MLLIKSKNSGGLHNTGILQLLDSAIASSYYNIESSLSIVVHTHCDDSVANLV